MNTRVGIIIPTLNRSEFLVRQLKYYASTRCPHTIYIGDSSTPDHAKTIQDAIKKFSNEINIKYFYCPEFDIKQCTLSLFNQVQEKYTTYIGDDDFQIPRAVSRCAEFLETNDDYASAHGCAVAIRIENNSVYGKINKIKDYPQPAINDSTAQERILRFFTMYFPTFFSVVRTKNMRQSYLNSCIVTDKSFSEEILPSALTIVDGKSKYIDCLGFVRQIHNAHYELPNIFDWITDKDWDADYLAFQKIVAEEISKKDTILPEKAKTAVRQAFWSYLQKWLALDYQTYMTKQNPRITHPTMKEKIRKHFSLLLPIYKMIKPYIIKKKWIHAEVINPSSIYYKDFKAVKDIIENISN